MNAVWTEKCGGKNAKVTEHEARINETCAENMKMIYYIVPSEHRMREE